MRVLSAFNRRADFIGATILARSNNTLNLQSEQQAFYFIADLHALTTVRDPAKLREYTWKAALDLLALGLDPDKATLFVQSDVPEVCELCWLLMTLAPMPMLENCHAYKDKKQKGLQADAGLFTYPVLMAADILAYDSDVVPVGQDQVQHIEVARDLAGSFNHLYGETFVLPKPKILSTAAKVPGTDGEKMSKSYNNTLEVFADAKAQRKQIMRITTDSRPMEQPKEPEGDHLFELFSLFARPLEIEEMAALYRRGGFGYGEVKKALADVAERYFAEARERRAALVADSKSVSEILAAGAERARKKARTVLTRAQENCGLRVKR